MKVLPPSVMPVSTAVAAVFILLSQLSYRSKALKLKLMPPDSTNTLRFTFSVLLGLAVYWEHQLSVALRQRGCLMLCTSQSCCDAL